MNKSEGVSNLEKGKIGKLEKYYELKYEIDSIVVCSEVYRFIGNSFLVYKFVIGMMKNKINRKLQITKSLKIF